MRSPMKTVNLNATKVCGYCDEEKKVHVKTKDRIIKQIKKVPNGLHRCTSCEIDSIYRHIQQQERLKAG